MVLTKADKVVIILPAITHMLILFLAQPKLSLLCACAFKPEVGTLYSINGSLKPTCGLLVQLGVLVPSTRYRLLATPSLVSLDRQAMASAVWVLILIDVQYKNNQSFGKGVE